MGIRNPKVVAEVKIAFLTLCEQYERMGQFQSVHAQGLVDKSVWYGTAGDPFRSALAQFKEMGEQLKALGRGIDLLGGQSVLKPPIDG